MSLQATSSSKDAEAHAEEAPKPTPKLQSAGGVASGGRPEPAPSSAAPAKGFVEQMPDMTLLQCCTSANFWLLFLTCSIGVCPPSPPPSPFDLPPQLAAVLLFYQLLTTVPDL